jgi:exopolysaccharide biosynthesis polyprenyl glycosylphosphotransferase
MIEERQKILAFNLFLADLGLTAASFFLAYALRNSFEIEGFTVMPIGVYLWILALILPIWAVLLRSFRVYSPRFLQIREQLVQLSKAIGLACVIMAAILFLLNQEATSRLIALFALVLNYGMLVSYRLALFAIRGWNWTSVRHVAIIGEGQVATAFARSIENHAAWGLKPTGIFPEKRAREIIEDGGIDEMIFVVDRQRLDPLEELFLLCEELGITARIVLNLFPHSIAHMDFHKLDGFSLLTFSPTPSDESLLFVRRLMDVVLAVIIGVLTLPLMAATVVAIKVTSPGPALFCQQRSGLHGRPFIMYKFRSMINDAEQRRVELESINEMDGPVFKSSLDPRITSIGKTLRRFSIDELPQLHNVLKGDMSLVGPRPPLPQEVKRYKRWQRRRLSMKPGMTCLWQIAGRNQVGFDEWMRLDLQYIDNWSLLLDLKILIKTIPVVLLGKGAV